MYILLACLVNSFLYSTGLKIINLNNYVVNDDKSSIIYLRNKQIYMPFELLIFQFSLYTHLFQSTQLRLVCLFSFNICK